MMLRSPVRCFSVRNLFVLIFIVLVLVIIFYVFNNRIADHRADTVEVLPWSTGQPLEAHFVNQLTARDMDHFANPLTPRDMDILNRTFRVFVQSVEAANLTYFIYGGTLLGSLRHHNRIPWDDDVDVLMKIDDKNLIEKTLSKLYPDYGIDKIAEHVWKFYPTFGRYIVKCKHRSPFLDVIFFSENETHVWNVSPKFRAIDVWPKQKVFPLHRRPYGDLTVTAPCNGLAVMGQHFNISVCMSRSYNHIAETSLTPLTLPCDRLAHIYPFVSRSRHLNGSLFVQETLMLGDRQLKSITARAPC